MPLLYALAVYAVSGEDIKEVDLPDTDKATIKKVSMREGVTSSDDMICMGRQRSTWDISTKDC